MKEDMKKRGLPKTGLHKEACPRREACTSGDDAAEEWSTPGNWGKDSAIKVERRRK